MEENLHPLMEVPKVILVLRQTVKENQLQDGLKKQNRKKQVILLKPQENVKTASSVLSAQSDKKGLIYFHQGKGAFCPLFI